jgi:hypothetical protein
MVTMPNKEMTEEQRRILEEVRKMEARLNEQEFSSEDSKKIRNMMMKESPKVRKLPKRLYHGSRPENKASIEEQGIFAHRWFGQIYLCESPEDVLMFIPEPCHIYEIDPKQLLPKRFRISLDHNKRFYPCEVYAYYGDIPTDAITNVIPRGENQ